MQVFLNGQFLDESEAKISVDDRGFLFADGVYEVIRVYDGRAFLAEPHIQRLRGGLAALRIDPAAAAAVMPAADRLLDVNEHRRDDVIIYAQVTRGAAPRKHAFPAAGTPPTVYVTTRSFTQHPAAYFDEGVAAITVPDTRWSRCDIKSVSLLPNVLANQQAKDAGAFEALFVRDGVVLEGSHSNLVGVVDGVVVTYPECNYILGGITRRLVLDLARELGIPVREAAIFQEQLDAVDELFLSGTTTEVMPVTVVDGRPVGTGEPGPITRRLLQAYRERAGAAVAMA